MICTSPAGDLRTGDEPAGPSNCFGALCDLDGLEVDDGWPWPRSVPRKHVILVDISIRILTMVSKRKDADEDLYMCILAVINFMNFDYN